jgi:hypothetical protein
MLQAIGHLAVVTAEAEELLHQIYWKHGDLDDKKGPIVTDNINPKRLMEDILKFVSLEPSNSRAHHDLKIIFREFEDINTKRNHCIHWVWETIENKADRVEIGMGLFGYRPPPTYQVKRPIYRQSGIKAEPFSLADILQLRDDTIWLNRRLRSHTLSEKELIEKRREYDSLPAIPNCPNPAIKTFADLFWPAPWLDTPSQPVITKGSADRET